MKHIIIIVFFPCFLFPQQVLIKHLSNNINTTSAEINFVQINDTTAYFTVVEQKNGKLESNIYTTNFICGEWSEKKYAKYNFKPDNMANISFSDGNRIFFSICKDEMLDCKIGYMEKNKRQTIHNIPAISSAKFFNTQPFISQHNSQKVMYFVSDREGGFGGLDIWLSIIDNDGKFGIPINAGNKINSSANEVTPFYNKYDKMLYFSSDKKEGFGGLDIYKAEGKLNLWKDAENVEQLNSDQDDLYMTFYDENTGYFASNRKGAKFETNEYCCNDIFSFQYPSSFSDSVKRLASIEEHLPLALYFHNDQPDPNTMSITTNKSYKETYISYFIKKSDYEKLNPQLNNFFEDVLQKNFNTLNEALETLLLNLSNENNIELQIKGCASPLHTFTYNQALSQRRIASLVNYLRQFKHGAFKEHLDSQRLTIVELPLGERNVSGKVSDDPKNKKQSVYSIEAILERKIEIVNIILKE